MAQTANIDPAEIRKFEELASRWWDKQGEFKALHEMNPLRLNFINTGSPLESQTVCDIGCGGGILSESMAQCGATITGIDMGKAPLSIARLHALESELDIDYQQTTAEEMAQQSRQNLMLSAAWKCLNMCPTLLPSLMPASHCSNQVAQFISQPLTVIQNHIYLPSLARNT